MAETEVEILLGRYEKAKTERNKYELILSEAGKYAWPNSKDMYKTVNDASQGEIHTIDIYDSTAPRYSFRCAAGILSSLMPVGTQWFTFKAQDYDLNQDQSIGEWLSKAAKVVHQEIQRSKTFLRAMFSAIRSLIVFGTGIMSVEMKDGKLVYRSYHISNVFFEENSIGEIDVVMRRIFYTPRQAKQEWGNNLGPEVMKALEDKDKQNDKFEFVHFVFPNDEYDKTKIDSKPFVSMYINVKEKHLVKKGSFNEIPYLISRFEVAPEEIMGRSPITDMIPDIKMQNRLRKDFIESTELASRPPMTADDDSVVGQPVMEAGGWTYMRPGTRDPKPMNMGINPQLNLEMLQAGENNIKEALFVDLFQPLQDYRNMTAFEASKRIAESQIFLSPVVGPIQKDTFDPMIERTLNLIQENDKGKENPRIPAAPQEFEYDIVYHGQLAMAMSRYQAASTEIWLGKLASIAAVRPEIFDIADVDKAMVQDGLDSGVSPEVIRDEDDVIKIRQNRANAEQAIMQAALAEQASKAYKNVHGTLVGDAIDASIS